MSESQEENPQVKLWEERLMGKLYVAPGETAPQGRQTFSDSDLQEVEDFRVVGPNTPTTRDFRSERLNVLVDEHGVCTGVRFF